MKNNSRPPQAPNNHRRMSANPFAAVLNDDDDNRSNNVDVETVRSPDLSTNGTSVPASAPLPPRPMVSKNYEEIVDDEDDSDDSSQVSQSSVNGRVRPPRPSLAVVTGKSKRNLMQQRRRRRSSARFLQFSSTKENVEEDDDEENNEMENGMGATQHNHTNSTLQEMYQTAIRMNAENKINTTNTWNLHIIDQMDTLLSLSDKTTNKSSDQNSEFTQNKNHGSPTSESNESTRVNFTKASCTLDASVKIYSYRVDDVHLTSYKVLANLNRTQNDKHVEKNNKQIDPNSDGGNDDENIEDKNHRKEQTKSFSGNTLESNIDNINLNKLDSAYDIDPLFHKMSKTFDEGGAKGLLLANLGVSESSCRIVFDSSAFDESNDKDMDSNADPSIEENQEDISNHTVLPRVPEGYMDISSLSDKLRSLLSDHCDDEWNDSNNIRSVSLVPQLSALRSEHEKLVDLGCCGPDAAIALAPTIGPKTPAGKVRQYHANSQQEDDADYSIHKEAIERSQRKLKFDGHDLNVSSDGALFPDSDISQHRDNVTTPGFDNSSIGDYGGGYDDGDDDDDCFDAFIANARYSEVSLAPSSNEKGSMENLSNNNPSTAVAALIDAISSGTTVLAKNDYEFFSNKNISSSSANEWAGAAHWKRNTVTNKAIANKASVPVKKSKKKSSKLSNKETKELSLVDFNHAIAPDLSNLLNPTTKQKKTAASSTVLSKALITKYTNDENVLPYDVGFNPNGSSSNSLHQLTKFFLRPNISILQPSQQNHLNIAPNRGQAVEVKKIVDFNLQPTTDWGMDDNDDENNDGPGFDFGGNDDSSCDDEYVVPMLDNVRKVDKVRVGFATVAKKVDVKRLKRDLWNELESHFNSTASDEHLQENNVEHATATIIEDKPAVAFTNEPTVVSFQDTVRILGQQQAQTDITLPFYFICILHLANEKGLRLEQSDGDVNIDTENVEVKHITAQQRLLSDFTIHQDETIHCENY